MTRRTLFALVFLPLASFCRGATFTWTGTLNGQWTNGLNWGQTLAGVVPGSSDLLVFPPGGTNRNMTNGYPANSVFWRMDFQSNSYILGGNSLILNASNGQQARILASHLNGTTTINAPIVLGNGSPGPSLMEASGINAKLLLAGTVNAAVNDLELKASALSSVIELQGQLSGGAGSITVAAGSGIVRITGYQAYAGAIAVSGHLQVNHLFDGGVNVAAAGTVSGTSTIGGPSAIHGDLDIGEELDTETLVFGGTLTFGAGSDDDVIFDLQGTTPQTGYDQLILSGTAGLVCNGARIHLRANRGFALGTSFLLIDKQSSGAINSTNPFLAPDGNKIEEGSIISYGFNTFQFSYVGGTGNDFTATVVPTPSGSGTAEWDGGGGGAGTSVSNPLNWLGNSLPNAANTLLFGALAPNRIVDFDVFGTNFYALNFTASGYTLDGYSILLGGGISASHAAGINVIQPLINLTKPQTLSLTGGGNLILNAIDNSGHLLTVNNSHAASTLLLQDGIAGAGGLTKNGAGRVEMSGSESNTYEGTTTINRGELRVTRSGAVTAIPGDLIVGNGADAASFVATTPEKIGNTAAVTVNANGTFSPATETIGAMNLNGGLIDTAANNLTITQTMNVNATSTAQGNRIIFGGAGSSRAINVASGATLTFANTVEAAVGITLAKSGAGVLRFAGTLIGADLAITGGTVIADGNLGTDIMLSSASSLLRGSGTVQTITSSSSLATISPDDGANPAGSLTTGSLSFVNGFAPRLVFTIGTNQGSSDMIESLGNVTLANATLVLDDSIEPPPPGTQLILIRNDDNDPVSGTFLGLSEGAVFSTARGRYFLTYAGGTGNDVILTSIQAPSGPPTLTSLTVTAATASAPATISANIFGPALNQVSIQASRDLGATDPWVTIGTVNLGPSGAATILNLTDPGSVGAPKNFFRFRYP